VMCVLLWASTVESQQQQQQQQQMQHPRIQYSHTKQAAAAAAAAAAAGCPDGFGSFGSYCLRYGGEGFTQSEAVDYCSALGGGATLTYPVNDDDIEAWKTAVEDADGSVYPPWGGATQSGGGWTWVDGRPVRGDAWYPGEPDGYGSGPCSEVAWIYHSGPLRNWRCDAHKTVICQVTLDATSTTELPETTNPTLPSETTIWTETPMTTTELPETTDPTEPSETTIWTETPTTTAGLSELCFSCLDCADVDDTTNKKAKANNESCFTTIYGTGDIVIRGVSPNYHQDGDCELINSMVYCFCNQNLCNGHHAF